jgi:hypothetical protein
LNLFQDMVVGPVIPPVERGAAGGISGARGTVLFVASSYMVGVVTLILTRIFLDRMPKLGRARGSFDDCLEIN